PFYMSKYMDVLMGRANFAIATSFLSASQDDNFLCFDGVSFPSISIQWRNCVF
ncbi:MAG: hypothetical protein F6K35_41435, partial [Okeania sp. SIO2H7]|nr:hypothetical protein [Okeania sp. SIO2H7]